MRVDIEIQYQLEAPLSNMRKLKGKGIREQNREKGGSHHESFQRNI